MIALAVTVYVAVLMAELVGDKTLYTVGTLAARHSSAAVLGGATVGVCLKMLAAVLLGHVIAALPPAVVSLVSAVTFVAMAVSLWRSKPQLVGQSVLARRAWMSGVRAAFLGIFLTEWADFGQVTAATLVAEYGCPWLVWVCASLAMLTKVTVAALFGAGFRRWVPVSVLRPITAATCMVMAVLAAFRVA